MAALAGAFDGSNSVRQRLMAMVFNGDGVWLKQGNGEARIVFYTSGGGWRWRVSMIAMTLR